MKATSAASAQHLLPPPLPVIILTRVISWEDWERGRAARREFCRRLNGGRPLRRAAGDPRKDALLRKLNNGERGLRFAEGN